MLVTMTDVEQFNPETDPSRLSQLIEERAAARLVDEWSFRLNRVVVTVEADGSVGCAFEPISQDQHEGVGGFSVRVAASEMQLRERSIQEIADLIADRAMRFLKSVYPEIECFPIERKKA